MNSNALSVLMMKDHYRLMEYLSDVENNLGRDSTVLSNAFNRFQWNIEKHFFTEEKAIFISYNPDDPDKDYTNFSELMDQHTMILDEIQTLREKLQEGIGFDVTTLKTLLMEHKTFEEESIYSMLDQEIDVCEKRVIIDRIQEIRL